MVSIYPLISHFLKAKAFSAAFSAALSPDYKRYFSFAENLESTVNHKEEMKTILLPRNKAIKILM